MWYSLWNIPEGFATLVAGIFAIVAAIIAWLAVQRQIRAAQAIEATKLRLDLYNRRFQIFESIFDFYDALHSWKGTPEQKAAHTKFFRAYQESGFLFNAEVEDVLRRLDVESARVIGFKEHSKEFLSGGPEFFSEQFKETNRVLIVEFGGALTRLKELMDEYLNFRKIKP